MATEQPKTVTVPASLFAQARDFIASMQNIVQKDMSFVAIASKSEKLVGKLDNARKESRTNGKSNQ